MIISNLEYLERLEGTEAIGGSGVAISVNGEASGELTKTKARTKTWGKELPFGGSIAHGVGHVVAIGGSGVAIGVEGVASGELTKTKAGTKTWGKELPSGGSIAHGVGHVVGIAVTPPSPH